MKKWVARIGFFLFVISVVGLIFSISLWVSLPSKEDIRGCLVTTMFQVKLCPGSSGYVKLSDISNHIKKAVVSAEDSLFYQHKGFDWDAIQSSFEKNLSEGRYARGGSTITQQLAKNMFLSKNKSLWRKFREALITKEIEETLKKSEILERYLNVVQFGKNIFGVKNAAKFYFKKKPIDLSLNESIFLVFLLPSPEKYSHSYFRKELTIFARKRMKALLNSMKRTGKISDDDFQGAVAQLAYFPSSQPIHTDLEKDLDQVTSNKEDEKLSESDESEIPLKESPKTTEDESLNIPTLEQLESELIEEN